MMQRWRDDLKQFADLSGWDMKNRKNEANLVQELVRHVLNKLTYTKPRCVANHPIGLDFRIDDVMRVLANDVWMIGNYGMGGIGKNILQLNRFDFCCLLFPR
ncbi:hypothetical protein AMTRI_Chr05g73840 [Amborella trichopoda]